MESQPEPLKLIAPPPVMYIVAYISGCVIHILLPAKIFVTSYIHVVAGLLLFLVGIGLARWSFMTMRRNGTTGNPRQPSTALVTTGPFRISRNPVYLAMTGLYIGLSFIQNSVWPLLFLVPLLLMMEWGVIRREEKYLAAVFGEAYDAYRQRVRRWI